jgi:hypothetical protein
MKRFVESEDASAALASPFACGGGRRVWPLNQEYKVDESAAGDNAGGALLRARCGEFSVRARPAQPQTRSQPGFLNLNANWSV